MKILATLALIILAACATAPRIPDEPAPITPSLSPPIEPSPYSAPNQTTPPAPPDDLPAPNTTHNTPPPPSANLSVFGISNACALHADCTTTEPDMFCPWCQSCEVDFATRVPISWQTHQQFIQSWRDEHCPKEQRPTNCPDCHTVVSNTHFEARCIQGACALVNTRAIKQPSILRSELPDPEHCELANNGWQCTFTIEYRKGQDDAFTAWEAPLQHHCEALGGRWHCYGFCRPHYPRHCEFPFPDGGKPCTDSSQCQNKCQAMGNGTGQCSDWPLTCTSPHTELINGTPKPSLGICD